MTFDQLTSMTVAERLAHFVAWLATQPRDIPYSYRSTDDCALCKYGNAHFTGRISAGGSSLSYNYDDVEMMPPIPANNSPVSIYDSPIYQFQQSRTLGELYDRLAPLVGAQCSLTDAEMDAMETRALVPFDTRRR